MNVLQAFDLCGFVLSPVNSGTTQFNWTSSWLQLCRYKWGFKCTATNLSKWSFGLSSHGDVCRIMCCVCIELPTTRKQTAWANETHNKETSVGFYIQLYESTCSVRTVKCNGYRIVFWRIVPLEILCVNVVSELFWKYDRITGGQLTTYVWLLGRRRVFYAVCGSNTSDLHCRSSNLNSTYFDLLWICYVKVKYNGRL